LKTIEWLDRKASAPLPFYGLCTSEEAYYATLKKLGERAIGDWVSPGAHAMTHYLRDKTGKTCCIVCLKDTKGTEIGCIVSLLVHEAVHIWQHYCRDIGESNPSDEFEAYTIQWISQQLMFAYDKQAMERKAKS